jgi:DNA-binding NtrC family response regulator
MFEEVDSQGPVVLVVDDDPQLRTAILRVLRSAGIAAAAARNSADALDTIRRSNSIFVLLTDIILPRGSGLELAGLAVAFRPELRVIYMSGHPEDPHVKALKGQSNFLQKPFDIESLVSMVRGLIPGPGPSPHQAAA